MAVSFTDGQDRAVSFSHLDNRHDHTGVSVIGASVHVLEEGILLVWQTG